MAYLTNTDSMLAVWNKGCMRNVSSFIIFHRTGNTFDRPTSTRVSAPQCWCFIHQQHRVETRLNETWYFHHDYYVVYYMKYFRVICGSSDVAVTETNSLACTLSDSRQRRSWCFTLSSTQRVREGFVWRGPRGYRQTLTFFEAILRYKWFCELNIKVRKITGDAEMHNAHLIQCTVEADGNH